VRVAGRTAWAAVACPPLAGAFWLWARWHADQMVARGEGWEMAFYFSPLAFLVMDGLLLLAGFLGLAGAFLGPRWYHRVVAVAAGAAGVGWFTQLPWR
jgi:hypothetical protein